MPKVALTQPLELFLEQLHVGCKHASTVDQLAGALTLPDSLPGTPRLY